MLQGVVVVWEEGGRGEVRDSYESANLASVLLEVQHVQGNGLVHFFVAVRLGHDQHVADLSSSTGLRGDDGHSLEGVAVAQDEWRLSSLQAFRVDHLQPADREHGKNRKGLGSLHSGSCWTGPDAAICFGLKHALSK